jgi:hypothetical protein
MNGFICFFPLIGHGGKGTSTMESGQGQYATHIGLGGRADEIQVPVGFSAADIARLFA